MAEVVGSSPTLRTSLFNSLEKNSPLILLKSYMLMLNFFKMEEMIR